MIVAFPQIQIGSPARYKSLAVFPLFTDLGPTADYRLSEQALGDSTVVVEEVSQQGSVPELEVRNTGETRVLFLEGEELRGAKQNRVLNASVLIGAGSTTVIPVSCVEQGRWRYRTTAFHHSGATSPSSIRYLLKKSVGDSVRRKRGHHSDQGAIWREIERQHKKHRSQSDTLALSDTFAQFEPQIADCRQQLAYVSPAIGIAVAIGPTVVSIDLFDKASTCAQVWSHLLAGLTLDAVEHKAAESTATDAEVRALYDLACASDWKSTDHPGEGLEYRTLGDRVLGSALVCDSSLVHGSFFVAV